MNSDPGPADFRRAQFLTSAPGIDECPPDSGVEVAFAGRSNAGKSSAINALTGNGKLARTSKTPGRTRLLNFFELDAGRRLVDLPGYGFAKVPQAIKHQWQAQLETYLSDRSSLAGVILLMDIRHPLKEFDCLILNWALASEMPVHVLLTKADKLKFGAAKQTLQKVQREVADDGDLVTVQLFSALKKSGLPELEQQLRRWLVVPAGEDEPGSLPAQG